MDSRKAAWRAIQKGSEIIRDVQLVSQRKQWESLQDARHFLNSEAQELLNLRLNVIRKFKQAPHHARGYRLSQWAGAKHPRGVNSLCLISGHEGQEIPGLVKHDRVVVDAEHMQQALGPATIDEIFHIRSQVGEFVYISTNVSETPQIVHNIKTGLVDTRSTAALTASKIISAIQAGADVIKVGFANLDYSKRDLSEDEVLRQMQLTRQFVDRAVSGRAVVMPLNGTGHYPLISVFFPEIGINSIGDRPIEIAEKAIELTAKGGWQGVLIDTYDKVHGKRYADFYSVEETAKLAQKAHERNIEFWIAGSIRQNEIQAYVQAKIDLICFGGAARHGDGMRNKHGDESIKRDLVGMLVEEFEKADPAQPARPHN